MSNKKKWRKTSREERRWRATHRGKAWPFLPLIDRATGTYLGPSDFVDPAFLGRRIDGLAALLDSADSFQGIYFGDSPYE